jgi:hypothetical protein
MENTYDDGNDTCEENDRNRHITKCFHHLDNFFVFKYVRRPKIAITMTKIIPKAAITASLPLLSPLINNEATPPPVATKRQENIFMISVLNLIGSLIWSSKLLKGTFEGVL